MILLVSAASHTTGLKGNIYDMKDDKEAVDRLSNLRARQGIHNVIDTWFTEQLR
jgi:Mn-containing catalase